MWGIVGLGARDPASILEQAVAPALLGGIRSYKSVRAIADQLLAKALARLEASQPQLLPDHGASPLTQLHELIRNSAEGLLTWRTRCTEFAECRSAPPRPVGQESFTLSRASHKAEDQTATKSSATTWQRREAPFAFPVRGHYHGVAVTRGRGAVHGARTPCCRSR